MALTAEANASGVATTESVRAESWKLSDWIPEMSDSARRMSLSSEAQSIVGMLMMVAPAGAAVNGVDSTSL